MPIDFFRRVYAQLHPDRAPYVWQSAKRLGDRPLDTDYRGIHREATDRVLAPREARKSCPRHTLRGEKGLPYEDIAKALRIRQLKELLREPTYRLLEKLDGSTALGPYSQESLHYGTLFPVAPAKDLLTSRGRN